jgi:ABC-type uncharacterized transport system substrate-binding protein
MRRREFIAGLGGAAAWPLLARAQPSAMPIIGCLINGSPADAKFLIGPFREGLADAGYVEGQNVAIEYRWAEGRNERLSALAAELVELRVAVLAAKKLTTTIPIVFQTGGDATELGLVTNLDRPEGNLTGVNGITDYLVTKQLDLLRQLMPRARAFALLTNPASPNARRLQAIAQAAAKTVGRELIAAAASNESEIESAFAMLAERRPGGVIIPTNALFLTERRRVVTLAANTRIPAVYDVRAFAEAGGLISYGQSTDRFRQVGVYVGKILRGATPADLPVVRPTHFELVVNRSAAKALGLDIPPAVLSQVDDVID